MQIYFKFTFNPHIYIPTIQVARVDKLVMTGIRIVFVCMYIR